jgi:hypothetical protein
MLLSILSVKLKDLSAAIWKSMRLKLKSLRTINQCVLISIFFGCKFEKKFRIFDFFGQTLENHKFEKKKKREPCFSQVT